MHRKAEEESHSGVLGDDENAAGRRLGGAYVKRLRMLGTGCHQRSNLAPRSPVVEGGMQQ